METGRNPSYAYPQQWANANGPASFAFVACAGATTSDVLSSQVSALSSSTTLVSISIGGNDIGFASVMETCVLESTSSCESAVAGAEAKVASPLPSELDSVLQTIRRDAPAAKIVVLDYPELYDLSRSSSCIGLSTADRTALNQGADDLDSADDLATLSVSAAGLPAETVTVHARDQNLVALKVVETTVMLEEGATHVGVATERSSDQTSPRYEPPKPPKTSSGCANTRRSSRRGWPARRSTCSTRARFPW